MPRGNSLSFGQRWGVAAFAVSVMSLSHMDRQVLAVMAPEVTARIGLSDAQYGMLQSGFAFAFLIGSLVAGRMVDRHGVMRILPVAIALWSILAGLHGAATGFASLLVFRVLLGLAEGPTFPSVVSLINSALKTDERPRGLGFLFTGSSIGAMLAPLVAGLFFAAFGWRAAFFGSAILGMLWLIPWKWMVSRPAIRKALSVQTDAHSPTTNAPRLLGLLKSRSVLGALAMMIGTAPLVAFVLLWFSKMLVFHHGLAQSDVLKYLWIPPVAFDLGCVIFGDLMSRAIRNSKYETFTQIALMLVGALLAFAVVLVTSADSVSLAVTAAAAAMFGGGGIYTLFTSDLFSNVKKERVAGAGGLLAATQSAVFIVVNPLIGVSVSAFDGYHSAGWIIGAACSGTAALWAFSRIRLQHPRHAGDFPKL